MFSSRRKFIVFIAVLLMFLSMSIRPSSKVQQHDDTSSLPKKLLNQAFLSNSRLHARAKTERGEQAYLEIIDLYKQVFDVDQDHRYGDEALLAIAQLCEEMALQLQKSRYHYSAIDYYQQLIEGYPDSPHRALALISTAQIFEKYLSDKQEAARAYREVSLQFPNSVSGREASANLIRLTAHNDHTQPDDNLSNGADDNGEKTITSIRSFYGADYARVVIDLTAPVTYEKNLSNTNNLVLQMRDARLAPELTDHNLATNASGLLKQVVAEAGRDGARLSLECDKIHDYAIFTLNNPHRLVIDLRGITTAQQSSPSIPVPDYEMKPQQAIEPPGNGEISFMRVLGLKVNRIVIDAGHGGHDTGALGVDGLLEKELVLDVALKLRALIKKQLPNIDVVMTRDSDRFVALEERTAIANAQAADLFISVHANSSPNREASGVETYYLSINANKDELEVAARENASTARNARDLQTLLQRIVLDDKVIESRDFAQLVQRSLVNGLGRINADAANNRGVKKAPFIVLIGANMPSVLAEISFVSNPQQANALKTGEFRQQIAESLFDGIKHYIDTLAKGLPAAASANK